MGVSAAGNAWNPRFGVAYQYTEKTVIRAGYGRSFDLGVFGSTFGHVVTQNIPVLANQSLNGTERQPRAMRSILSDPTNTSCSRAWASPITRPARWRTTPRLRRTANGQIPITETDPGYRRQRSASRSSVKARPFTERLPTLDAWNMAVQHSINADHVRRSGLRGQQGNAYPERWRWQQHQPERGGNFPSGVLHVRTVRRCITIRR